MYIKFLQDVYEYVTEKMKLATGDEFHHLNRLIGTVSGEINALRDVQQAKNETNRELQNERLLMSEIQKVRDEIKILQSPLQHLKNDSMQYFENIKKLKLTKKDKYWNA